MLGDQSLKANNLPPSTTADEMDQADEELRHTITHIWPLQADRILDLLVPRKNCLNNGNMTVGKIYAGLLIADSWRTTRFGKLSTQSQVRAE